jgi:hypothetical protein
VIVEFANFSLAWSKSGFSLDCGENRRFVIFVSDESASPRKENSGSPPSLLDGGEG